jgi:catechol 2,3-dioxygenase-like lactoylglutathione lyase family enzyme
MSPGIIGAHVLLYSDKPEADRAFFRDILGFPAVDAGGGWLIFALPPAEVGIHPSDGERRQLHGGRQLLGSVLYLMCDDLTALMKTLQSKDVTCSPVEEEAWGAKTTIRLPSGGEVGLYQPTHATALGWTSAVRDGSGLPTASSLK